MDRGCKIAPAFALGVRAHRHTNVWAGAAASGNCHPTYELTQYPNTHVHKQDRFGVASFAMAATMTRLAVAGLLLVRVGAPAGDRLGLPDLQGRRSQRTHCQGRQAVCLLYRNRWRQARRQQPHGLCAHLAWGCTQHWHHHLARQDWRLRNDHQYRHPIPLTPLRHQVQAESEGGSRMHGHDTLGLLSLIFSLSFRALLSSPTLHHA